ncbi:MAG TPA: helix-turn-helix domain-containing protein [Herpetosiphonaceae bacterium]|nr:helix-turn-helix domain-containing protein [Herpetosiphonaceae bacterium]
MHTALPFGQWLRRCRTASNLTQAALAERVGCSPDVLRKFESQAKRPSRRLAEQLAAELGLAEAERDAFVQAARGTAPVASEASGVHVKRTAPQEIAASANASKRIEGLWLARTKLYPPRVRADILPRPGLYDAFHRALAAARLVLISAPAGTGKTTLVTTAVAAAPSRTDAWLTVDADDNDLVRFLQALVAAIAGSCQPSIPSRNTSSPSTPG